MSSAAFLKGIKTDGLRFRLINAKNQIVGRLAAHISMILQGKDKPTYAYGKEDGDVCIVINAAHVVFTGRKWKRKIYRWHTGYPGGLVERTAQEIYNKKPEAILYKAVSGMLPKNNLRKFRLRKLKLFPDENHPFHDVKLMKWVPPYRKLRDRGLGFIVPEGFTPLNPEAYWQRMKASKLFPLIQHRKDEWGIEDDDY